MARIDEYSQKWFTGVDNYTDEQYLIEYLSPEEDKKLREKATTNTAGKDKFDLNLYEELMIDRVLKDWKGLTIGKDDKPAPCTSKNKKFALSHRVDLAPFIGEHCRVSMAYSENYDELKKNWKELLSGNFEQNGTKQSKEPVESV